MFESCEKKIGREYRTCFVSVVCCSFVCVSMRHGWLLPRRERLPVGTDSLWDDVELGGRICRLTFVCVQDRLTPPGNKALYSGAVEY